MNPVAIVWTMVVILVGGIIVFIDGATRGFISAFLMVSMSRGKRIFMTIKSINGTYFRAGKVKEENAINYKDQNKVESKLVLPDGFIFENMFGHRAIDFDEIGGAIITHKAYIFVKTEKDDKGKIKTTFTTEYYKETVFDTKKVQDYIKRALTAPDPRKDMKKSLFPIIVLICFAVTLWLLYQVYTRQAALHNDIMMVKAAVETALTNTTRII